MGAVTNSTTLVSPPIAIQTQVQQQEEQDLDRMEVQSIKLELLDTSLDQTIQTMMFNMTQLTKVTDEIWSDIKETER